MEFYDFEFSDISINDDIDPPFITAEIVTKMSRADLGTAHVATLKIRIPADSGATIQQIRERAFDEARDFLRQISSLFDTSGPQQMQDRAIERRASAGEATIQYEAVSKT